MDSTYECKGETAQNRASGRKKVEKEKVWLQELD
jgi:hypothetical protein